jgi:mono/diheme cytochrome c family protein
MNGSRTLAFAGALAAVLGTLALPPLPAGAGEYLDLMKKGKEAFASQCITCHQTADEAASGYRKRPSWQKIVADMVARGAKLDQEQQDSVVEYLAGRMLLVAKCGSCHTSLRPLTVNKNLEGWKGTVESMVQRMPPLLRPTPEEINRLSVFLAVERAAP